MLGVYPVNHPATYDFLTAADGATDATNHIAAMATDRPNTRIVPAVTAGRRGGRDMPVSAPLATGSRRSACPAPAGQPAGNAAAVAVFGNLPPSSGTR